MAQKMGAQKDKTWMGKMWFAANAFFFRGCPETRLEIVLLATQKATDDSQTWYDSCNVYMVIMWFKKNATPKSSILFFDGEEARPLISWRLKIQQ